MPTVYRKPSTCAGRSVCGQRTAPVRTYVASDHGRTTLSAVPGRHRPSTHRRIVPRLGLVGRSSGYLAAARRPAARCRRHRRRRRRHGHRCAATRPTAGRPPSAGPTGDRPVRRRTAREGPAARCRPRPTRPAPAGRRMGQRRRHIGAGIAAVQLGQPVIERVGGGEQSVDEDGTGRAGLRIRGHGRQSEKRDCCVVRPDGAVVIRQRVIGGIHRGHGSQAVRTPEAGSMPVA
jgi:hypothetical protein